MTAIPTAMAATKGTTGRFQLVAWSAVTLWSCLICWWLLTAGRVGVPEVLSRLAALAAIATTAAALVVGCRRAVARDRRALVPLGLVALALAVRFAGIDHEVAERYYLDEGTYARHAADINRGELLVSTFVYPHLLYYLDAFVIWTASLFGGAVVRASNALFGIADWPVVCRLLMRSVSALLGALTVLPVAAIARLAWTGRPADAGARTAVLFAGLLAVFSPLYNDGAHLAICDVPAAFFATVSLAFCARLVGGETRRDYLLAGAAAGLAAAAKYPAGLVAIAIVSVALRGAWRARRVTASLLWMLWAAGSAIAVFLMCNPALLVYPKLALFGERGMFFGVFQYAGEGWLGVVPRSPALYYLQALAENFGWPALIAGTVGLVLAVRQGSGRKALWLLPFPVFYLALLLAMTVAVKRNLYPVLPALAALLGVGIATVLAGLPARWLPRVVLSAAVLMTPLAATVSQTAGFARPGTRVLARDWIRAHVPRGATIVKDDYTPDFDAGEYATWRAKGIRFVGQMPDTILAAPELDLILVSAGAYQRFFDPESDSDAEALAIRARYQRIFDSGTPLARFEPGRFRLGPSLALYRAVPPSPIAPSGAQRLSAAEVFVPDASMRVGDTGRVRYTLDGQWVLFKVRPGPGRLRCTIEGPAVPRGGALRLVDLANQELGRAELVSGAALIDIPADGKVFLYVELPPGAEIAALELAAAGG